MSCFHFFFDIHLFEPNVLQTQMTFLRSTECALSGKINCGFSQSLKTFQQIEDPGVAVGIMMTCFCPLKWHILAPVWLCWTAIS